MFKTLLISLMLISFVAKCQTIEEQIKIASEYLNENQIPKAKQTLGSIDVSKQNATKIYQLYTRVLFEDKDYEILIEFIQKCIKLNNNNLQYKTDLILALKKSGKQEQFEKEYKKLFKSTVENVDNMIVCGAVFTSRQEYQLAIQWYKEARNYYKENLLFAPELLELYISVSQTDEFLKELFNLFESGAVTAEKVKNSLQELAQNIDYQTRIEDILIEKTQNFPNSYDYADLLVWMYLQKADYSGLIIQVKAIDLRFKQEGRYVIEILPTLFQNEAYKECKLLSEYLISNLNGGASQSFGYKFKFLSQERILAKIYPPDTIELNNLISDMDKSLDYIDDFGQKTEVLLLQAKILSLYKKDFGKAREKYTQVIDNHRTTVKYQVQAKLELADQFIYQDEPWEASLLYTQIEKEQKDQPFGYEAKLRNARLNYFNGEFELATAHLDILKLATSREISNDAIELSLLIKNNSFLDTIGRGLTLFAKSEMLEFQGRIIESKKNLEFLIDTLPDHAITDDALWKLAKLQRKTKEYEKAILSLEKIIVNSDEEIYSDDALLLKGIILEEDLKQKDEALKIYEMLFTKFPGSTLSLESKKRFRKLRDADL